MAWVAQTSFETTDGSTAPTDGNDLVGTGDGTGWSGNWIDGGSGSYVDYDDDASAPDGTWAIKMDTSGTNIEPVVYRDLTTAVTSGRVSFRVKFNRDDRDNPGIYLYSGTTRILYTYFNQATTNTKRGLTGVSFLKNNVFAKDTWYKYDIDFDCTTDTFDLYVDDVKQNGSPIAFENTATTINRVQILNNAASGFSATLGNIMWVDKIAPGTTTPTFTPITSFFM